MEIEGLAQPIQRIKLVRMIGFDDGTMMAIWMQAGLWGLAGASSLLIGVALAWFAPFPKRVTTGLWRSAAGS